MNDKLQIVIDQIEPHITVIHFSGDLTFAALRRSPISLPQIFQPDSRQLLLNFRAEDYMDTGGIGLLLTLITQAQQQNCRILIAMPNPYFQKVFQTVGLPQFATLHTCLDDALVDARTQ